MFLSAMMNRLPAASRTTPYGPSIPAAVGDTLFGCAPPATVVIVFCAELTLARAHNSKARSATRFIEFLQTGARAGSSGRVKQGRGASAPNCTVRGGVRVRIHETEGARKDSPFKSGLQGFRGRRANPWDEKKGRV